MSKDWKDVLLRSGVPLEYEVGQLLAKKGFDVDADFPYMRKDVEGEKEHSIDVMAEKPLDSDKADFDPVKLVGGVQVPVAGKDFATVREPAVA